MVVRYRPFYEDLDAGILLPRLIELWELGGLGGKNLELSLWIIILILSVAVTALNTVCCTGEKVVQIVRDRLPVRALFPHIVHTGFLIALMGHLAGSLFGFKTTGNYIFFEEKIPVPHTESLEVRFDHLIKKISPEGSLKKIKTTVSLIDDGSEILTGKIEINKPLIYKGIAFYYAGDSKTPMGLTLNVDGISYDVPFGETFIVEDRGEPLKLGEIYPHLAFDEEGKPFNRSQEFHNPYVELLAGGVPATFLSLRSQGSKVEIKGMSVTLEDYVLKEYVVLNINKDPGILFIVVGSTVLTLGLILLLFFRGERSEILRRGRV